MKKIEEFPLYLLLKKINDGGVVKDYQDKIFTLLIEMDKESHLNKKDCDYIKKITVIFLNQKLQMAFDNEFIYSEKSRKENLDKFFNIYKILLDTDTKRKSDVWNPSTLALLDSNVYGRHFIDQHYPTVFKEKVYKQKGAELLSKKLIKLPNFIESIYEEAHYNKKINNIIELIERYDEKYINWNQLLKESPSLSLAILAKNYHYELKKEDFFNIFHHTKNTIQKRYHTDSSEMIQKIGDTYNDLLIDSTFFKNSLAPSKNIHQAVAKFLNSSISDINLSFPQMFTNYVINSKDYDLINYEAKLEKHSYYKVTGKWLLKPEEKEECKKIIEQSKSQTPKRNKI